MLLALQLKLPTSCEQMSLVSSAPLCPSVTNGVNACFTVVLPITGMQTSLSFEVCKDRLAIPVLAILQVNRDKGMEWTESQCLEE